MKLIESVETEKNIVCKGNITQLIRYFHKSLNSESTNIFDQYFSVSQKFFEKMNEKERKKVLSLYCTL